MIPLRAVAGIASMGALVAASLAAQRGKVGSLERQRQIAEAERILEEAGISRRERRYRRPWRAGPRMRRVEYSLPIGGAPGGVARPLPGARLYARAYDIALVCLHSAK